jgi:hypothetical protein
MMTTVVAGWHLMKLPFSFIHIETSWIMLLKQHLCTLAHTGAAKCATKCHKRMSQDCMRCSYMGVQKVSNQPGNSEFKNFVWLGEWLWTHPHLYVLSMYSLINL